MEPQVILVNENDEPVGFMSKSEAHQTGTLHRAFSIFIFNEKGEMLLQQRANEKYHSPGLWSNACCSHPQPNEELSSAVRRRLQEELGFETDLQEIFSFTYRADFENGVIEHEFDHVFTGEYNGTIKINKEEVQDVCYKSMNEITESLKTHPQKFTAWFHLAFPRVKKWKENFTSHR